jgi:uncharacterized membrane protein
MDTNVNQHAEPMLDQPQLLREEPRRLPREVLLLGAVALVFAAILRFIHVSYREIFGDEFFTLDYITRGRPDLLPAVFRGYLPIYYEFIRGWAKLFGTDSELLLRLPSAVLGLAACIAFFAFARRYLRGAAFAISLIAFAMNPILVATSNEATSYAALSLLAVLANYYFIRSLDEGRRKNWVRYGIIAALGALTHPLFWFLLLAHFLFAAGRPRQTPRPFVLASAAGVFLIVLLMIMGAIYAEQQFPKKLGVQAPKIDDLLRGLVAVVLGDFPRYGYWDREFIRALMYLFIVSALALSFVYYRKRALEAAALPENVLWIDETQDVVGKWNRLSLASFLMFQWVAFIVPAVCIMILGGFAPDMRLHPEFFIVCVPALVILIAAGIDATPGKYGPIVMGVVFVVFMGVYDYRALADHGLGVYDAFWRLNREKFDPQKDVLMYVTYPGLERSVNRYAGDIKGIPFTSREVFDAPELAKQKLAKGIEGKERLFVFYRNHTKRLGRLPRSPFREWMAARYPEWDRTEYWVLSRPEDSELWAYVRHMDALTTATDAATTRPETAPPAP